MEAAVQGILNVFTPATFLWIFLAVVIGVIVGILPGIGGVAAMAILIPVAYGKDPSIGLSFLLSVFAISATGGPITSILFGIPGESSSAATILDGHVMAQQGRAGRALGAALMASMVGGIFGAVWVAALIPVVRPIILAFGSPEILMMAVLGISSVALLGRGSLPKALVAACLGVLMAFVGAHRGTGTLRYTMGSIFLYDGLKLVPVLVGIFALPEVIDMMTQGTTIAKVDQKSLKRSDVVEGIKDVFQHWWLTLRCSAIATVLGFVPGIGAPVATWICYGHAKQTSKSASEFGRGCVEGVIAPEAADNAKDCGSLLTALAFGIPSGGGMAVLLAAIMMVGIVPGQEMMTKHLDLVWTLIITMIVANVLAAAMCILAAKNLAKVTFVRQSILVPVILLFVILGAYGINNDFKDVFVAFAVGGLGHLMQRFDYSRATLVIGFVLGDYIERYFLVSVKTLGPAFLLVSPIASALLIATMFGLAWGAIKKRSSRRLSERSKGEGGAETSGGFFFAAALFGVLIIFLIATLGYPAKAASFPLITISAALLLLAFQIVPHELFTLKRKREGTEGKRVAESRGESLGVILWLTMAPLMLWFLGFLATVLLFPFFYLRRHRERWLLSAGLPLGCGIFFYVIFFQILKMPLYKGLIFSLIFD